MGPGGPTTSVLSQFSKGPGALCQLSQGAPICAGAGRGARLHVVVVVTYDAALLPVIFILQFH